MLKNRWLLRGFVMMSVTLLLGATVNAVDLASQSDWSGGSGETGPVADWRSRLATVEGLSWRAVPGQLALSSTALATPLRQSVDGNASGAIKVVAADLDGDGDIDAASAGYYSHRITVYWNLGGTPLAWQAQVLDDDFTNAVGLSTADVDGDGLVDVLATAGGLAEVSWWRNLGGSPAAWQRLGIPSPYPAGHDVVAADVDGDGDLDILVPFFDDDAILYWINEGEQPVTFREQVMAENVDYPTKLAACDIDDDGDLDVAAVMWHDQDLAWWRNDGGETLSWVRRDVAGNLDGVHWVACADMDDDGRNDLLAASMSRSEIAMWRNLGGDEITWQRRTVTSGLAGAVSIFPADMDGDGDLDVLGGGWAPTGGTSWYENRGGAASWARHIVDAGFGETSSVHAADVDGDGDLDVLGTSWSASAVAWWEVSDFAEQGSLTSSILDTGGVSEWLSWEMEGSHLVPLDVQVEARAGQDPQAMGPWRELASDDLFPLNDDGLRYLQYRVRLQRTASGESPIIREIRFSWAAPRQPAIRHPRGRVSP